MLRILLPLVLLSNGVAAGVMVSTVIGIVPMTLVLPYEQYVDFIRFLWPRYDPVMPIMHVLTLVCDVILAILSPGKPARFLFVVAALLLATVMIVSISKNVPINRYVTSLNAAECPPNWADRDPRLRWRKWNLLRTILAMLALVANVIAAAMV